MWTYDKKLQYPVNIKNPNPKLAKLIITQFGGPDGELGAAMRYLSQRYSMPYNEAIGILTDIGIGDYFWAFHRKVTKKRYEGIFSYRFCRYSSFLSASTMDLISNRICLIAPSSII